MKACYIVAMEMSKSTKPRHFSDSSRECWDKNRHGQRTKSYLKKKKREKKSEEERLGKTRDMCVKILCMCVCVWLVKWCAATKQTRFSVKWWRRLSDWHSVLVWARKSHHHHLSLKQQWNKVRYCWLYKKQWPRLHWQHINCTSCLSLLLSFLDLK